MADIELTARHWHNPGNFWDDFLDAVQAPAWHGRNLDALYDSVTSGCFDNKQTHRRIVIRDAEKLPKSIMFLLTRIEQMFRELEGEHCLWEVTFSDGYPPGWDYVGRPDAFFHMRVLDLLREWDPIGVYGPGSNAPDDEYDGYADLVMSFLDNDLTPAGISDFLDTLARTSMGLPDVPRALHDRTAGRLIGLCSQRNSSRVGEK